MTQPTLSRQLMQLEDEVGVKLFRRSQYRVVLTEDGMLLRRRAQEIVELADKAERELQHTETELTGEIAIGCGETAAMTFLSEHIRAFRRQHPLVQFRIYSAIADDVKERIEKGLLDMGLLAAAMLLTLAACGTANTGGTVDEPKNNTAADTADPAPDDTTPESTGGKVLVAYFSTTGHTKTIAEYLQTALDADLYEIVPQEPYTDADLDYNTDGCRANREQNDDSARPAISGSVEDMDGYDVVSI